MESFRCDYAEGCAPQILEALQISNMEQTDGYGCDDHCYHAAKLIKERFACQNADVHFLVGGTQCNQIVISSFLRLWQSVIACQTGHINVHETGAIESLGHKVCTAVSDNGKLNPQLIQQVLQEHESEHMVVPAMVYISNTTEVGTVYTLAELQAISGFCRKNGLLLYLDGARIGSALCSDACDIQPEDYAKYCDAFYIGGTKNGALFGEAVVLVNDVLKPNFRHMIKQQGALLAKGRLLGIQFEELFKDDLFFKLAEHENKMAAMLAQGLQKLGVTFLFPAQSNQLFISLPQQVANQMATTYGFEWWGPKQNGMAGLRLVTSFATPSQRVQAFLNDLKILLQAK